MALQVTSKQAYSQLLAAARCKVEYFPAHERLLSELRDRHGASIVAAAEALAADAEAGRRETENLIDAIFGSRSPARRPPAAPRRRKRERPAAEKEEDLFGSASEGESEGEWESDEKKEPLSSSSSSSSSESESDVEAEQPSEEGVASGPSVPLQVPSAQEGPPPPSDHQAPSSAAEAACQPDRALLSAETPGQPSQSGGGPEALTCSASDPQQQRQQQPSSDVPVPHISTARGCSGTDEGLGPSSSNLAGRVAAREGGPSVDGRKRRRVHGTPGAASGPPGDLAVHTSADLVGHTSAPDPPRPAGTSRIQGQTTEFVKAVLEPMYRAQLLTKEMFKAVVRSAVDKILERHAPQHAQEAETRVPQHTPEGGQRAQDADHAGGSADFLIAEAESIRRFISKLVVFEKSRQQAGPL